MSNSNKIEILKSEIEHLKSSIYTAEKYPTDNRQFWQALDRQRQELSDKEQLLDKLTMPPDELNPKIYPKRTAQQNKALHVLFQLLANALNEAGLDMRKTLKPGIEIPWQSSGIKEYLWRPIQEAQLGKKSTTELTTVEIDAVFDTLTRHLGEKFGLHVPFPSIDELILRYEQEAKSRKTKSE